MKAHSLMARLRNATNFERVEEYVRGVRIPGWAKVILIVGIIAINTSVAKWWCNRRNRK